MVGKPTRASIKKIYHPLGTPYFPIRYFVGGDSERAKQIFCRFAALLYRKIAINQKKNTCLVFGIFNPADPALSRKLATEGILAQIYLQLEQFCSHTHSRTPMGSAE